MSFFVVGAGCEIKCVKTAESTNILCISLRDNCTIKLRKEKTYFKVAVTNNSGNTLGG